MASSDTRRTMALGFVIKRMHIGLLLGLVLGFVAISLMKKR